MSGSIDIERREIKLEKENSNIDIVIPTQIVNEPFKISKIFKILVVGNSKCGKTSIISKYVYRGLIDIKYKTTIGADFVRKDLLIDYDDSNSIGVRLQLWDIAGQDRFQKLTRAYFNNARGVVIVCDVSRDGTIEAVKNWKKEIDTWGDNVNCDLPVVLFANKSDLLTNPQDAFKTGATMERSRAIIYKIILSQFAHCKYIVCRELGFKGWWVTSAKSGDNLDEGFYTLIKEILDVDSKAAIDKENIKPTATIKITNKNIRSNVIRQKIDEDDEDYNEYDDTTYTYNMKSGDCC